jgi:hypothetical protein
MLPATRVFARYCYQFIICFVCYFLRIFRPEMRRKFSNGSMTTPQASPWDDLGRFCHRENVQPVQRMNEDARSSRHALSAVLSTPPACPPLRAACPSTSRCGVCGGSGLICAVQMSRSRRRRSRRRAADSRSGRGRISRGCSAG